MFVKERGDAVVTRSIANIDQVTFSNKMNCQLMCLCRKQADL